MTKNTKQNRLIFVCCVPVAKRHHGDLPETLLNARR